MTGEVSLNVALRIKPERVSDFIAKFQSVVDGARYDEEGCLQYDFARRAGEPTVFHVYEVYRDDAALAAHRASPHFTAWSALADEFLDGADARTVWRGYVLSRGYTGREGN